jgi:hypothetical protein
MPKRIFLAVAAMACALAACNSANPADIYGTATPSASAVPTLTPNPSDTAAAILVTYQGSPLPSQPVSLYSSSATSQTPGPLITTQLTDSTGATTFTNLTGAGWYCFSTSYTPPTPTPAPSVSPTPVPSPLTRSQTACTDLWFVGIDLRL